MAYWKCTDIKAIDEGSAISASFRDANTLETFSFTLSAEVVKNILVYRAAYDEPERRMWEAHRRMVDYIFNVAKVTTEQTERE